MHRLVQVLRRCISVTLWVHALFRCIDIVMIIGSLADTYVSVNRILQFVTIWVPVNAHVHVHGIYHLSGIILPNFVHACGKGIWNTLVQGEMFLNFPTVLHINVYRWYSWVVCVTGYGNWWISQPNWWWWGRSTEWIGFSTHAIQFNATAYQWLWTVFVW